MTAEAKMRALKAADTALGEPARVIPPSRGELLLYPLGMRADGGKA